MWACQSGSVSPNTFCLFWGNILIMMILLIHGLQQDLSMSWKLYGAMTRSRFVLFFQNHPWHQGLQKALNSYVLPCISVYIRRHPYTHHPDSPGASCFLMLASHCFDTLTICGNGTQSPVSFRYSKICGCNSWSLSPADMTTRVLRATSPALPGFSGSNGQRIFRKCWKNC